MDKKTTYIGVAVITILVLTVIVVVQSMSKPTPVVQTQPTTQPAPFKDEVKKPMGMQPVTPPGFTETQLVQLATGEAAHEPMSLTFDVVGGNFFYVPNVIHAKKGDTIKINFANGGGFHDFTLDEFKIKIGPLKDGETKSVEFVVDKTGTFEFYCSVGNHRQMGQKGTLIVE